MGTGECLYLGCEARTAQNAGHQHINRFILIQYYALDTQIRAMILGMGTVNAPEKGVIGRRFRRLLLFIVIASGVTELIKFLQSHGLLK